MQNIYQQIQSIILKQQTKNAIITATTNFYYQDLEAYSAKIANALAALNIKPGDRLAAQVEKSPYNIFLFLACLRSGIIYLPLNSSYSKEELHYFFSDAKPSLIVCDPSNAATIKKLGNCPVYSLDQQGQGSLNALWQQQSPIHDIYPSNSEDIAVILYTSGTTGQPKGAMITQQNLLSNSHDLIAAWGITANDTLLHMLPLFHVHGLFFGLLPLLLSGASILLLPKFDADLFFTFIHQVSLFMGVPTYYHRLLADQRLTPANCETIRLFISGSAPLLAETFSEFQKRSNHTILERYGMTETGINASNPLDGERKLGSVGLSLPHVTMRIVDDNNRVVAIGQVGRIQVKGNNVFKGYWNLPEKTAEEFTADHFFNTGDLGKWDQENYLYIVGRSKDMIISGGLNIYPKEIELTIDAIPGVVESAVIGVPHADFGEGVLAIVVANPNKVDEAKIMKEVRQHHAGFKCPKKIFFLDALPKNTMGKVQKNILRNQFIDVFSLL